MMDQKLGGTEPAKRFPAKIGSAGHSVTVSACRICDDVLESSPAPTLAAGSFKFPLKDPCFSRVLCNQPRACLAFLEP